MKRIKTIGLAVLAALALSAIVGAGSASADQTVLCKSSPEGSLCLEDRYPTGTSLEANSSKVVFNLEFYAIPVDVTCSESTLKGQTNALSGDPLAVGVSSLTFAGCEDSFERPCTVGGGAYSSSVEWASGADGVIDWRSMYVKCVDKSIFTPDIDCTYIPNSGLTLEGGSTAQLVANKIGMSEGQVGNKCWGEGPLTFTANYSVSSPKPVYVAKRAEVSAPASPLDTALCHGSESPCAEAFPAGTELKLQQSGFAIDIAIASPAQSMQLSCASDLGGVKSLAQHGKPLALQAKSWTLSGCSGAAAPYAGCSVETKGAPFDWSLTALEGVPTDGFLGMEAPLWKFTCNDGNQFTVDAKCTYQAAGGELPSELIGGQLGAEVQFGGVSLKAVEGSACPSATLTLSGGFAVTSPTPLYVAEF